MPIMPTPASPADTDAYAPMSAYGPALHISRHVRFAQGQVQNAQAEAPAADAMAPPRGRAPLSLEPTPHEVNLNAPAAWAARAAVAERRLAGTAEAVLPVPTLPEVTPGTTIAVSNDAELRAALTEVASGQTIALAAGSYLGAVAIAHKNGVALTAAAGAVLVAPAGSQKPNLLLTSCQNFVLTGLTLTGGQKGIMATGLSQGRIEACEVSHTAMEGVHIKGGSVDVVIDGCLVHDTGLGGQTPAGHNRVQADDGEGIYVGTAISNDPHGDVCSNIRITNNVIYNTTAENIDIKEFTRDGLITGNQLDGAGCTQAASANVNLKGSGWQAHDNTISHPHGGGFKVYTVQGAQDSGVGNVVGNNTIS